MLDTLQTWLVSQGLAETPAQFLAFSGTLFFLALFIVLVHWGSRRFLVSVVETAALRSPHQWDDTLAKRGFFHRLALLLPITATYFACDLIFPQESLTGLLLTRLALILLVLVSARTLDAFFHAAHDIYCSYGLAKGKPLRGYLQFLTIILYVMAGVLVLSISTRQPPWGIITVFGGLTAVLLLVFKDTLLGFVASIQLSATDMVRVGDWIEMPKYDADGEVIDVSINTIKVRNWDKTIVTIPTYALVSDSFKNWRGMTESGGRRIKRALFIDMNSVRFCNDEMLARFQRIELLKPYLKEKIAEINADNMGRQFDPATLVNSRQQTNLGVFRAYVSAYLRSHPKIRQNMTFLVRHLQPTPEGLPLEIYVFSSDQTWAGYETVQADIFDHLLAAIPEFGLRIFQLPSGHDLQKLQPPGSLSSLEAASGQLDHSNHPGNFPGQ